jgi:hypothetical protein
MEMRVKNGINLIVIHPEARLFRCLGREGCAEQQAKSQGCREGAQATPQVNRHSGESPGNDNPFPMMRILTQKMLGAQGLDASSTACHFVKSLSPAKFGGMTKMTQCSRIWLRNRLNASTGS